MNGTEIFKRSDAFDSQASAIRLHAPQWKLLLAFDGQRSLTDVALSLDLTFADALPLAERFQQEGWIEEQPITLEQYLKRTGTADSGAAGSVAAPSAAPQEARSPVAAPRPSPAPPAPMAPAKPAAVAIPEPAARTTLPAPATRGAVPPPLRASQPVAAAPVAPPVPSPAAAAPPAVPVRGPLPLKAVVDYIVAQVGNSSLGQLVVYRVFLRVPPQLLQGEDIASVHLLNDHSVVRTEELKDAIASSVLEVMKRPLPENVFASA